MSVVTPDLPEAELLTGSGPEDGRERLLVALGRLGPPVLLKGGHDSEPEVDDVLVSGDSREHILHPRRQTQNTHGAGCTLSSAITVRMARGESLLASVRGGIDFVQSAMAAGLDLGRGHGPLDHLVRLEGPDL
jgi:hydroxymethylpyrimidine/phosphomethylpyrimidine kinase